MNTFRLCVWMQTFRKTSEHTERSRIVFQVAGPIFQRTQKQALLRLRSRPHLAMCSHIQRRQLLRHGPARRGCCRCDTGARSLGYHGRCLCIFPTTAVTNQRRRPSSRQDRGSSSQNSLSICPSRNRPTSQSAATARQITGGMCSERPSADLLQG